MYIATVTTYPVYSTTYTTKLTATGRTEEEVLEAAVAELRGWRFCLQSRPVEVTAYDATSTDQIVRGRTIELKRNLAQQTR